MNYQTFQPRYEPLVSQTRLSWSVFCFYIIGSVEKSYLLKVVYGQPYLSLGVEHTTQVAPSHRKVGLSLNSLQVTRLQWINNQNQRRGRVVVGGGRVVGGRVEE